MGGRSIKQLMKMLYLFPLADVLDVIAWKMFICSSIAAVKSLECRWNAQITGFVHERRCGRGSFRWLGRNIHRELGSTVNDLDKD